MTRLESLTARRRQHGLSLVELMVGMTLSLLLMAALVTLIVRNGKANEELQRSSRQIENGRYAIDLLSDDLSLAGYFDGVSLAGTIRTAGVDADPCATDPAAMGWSMSPLTVPVQVEAYDGASAGPGCTPHRLADTAVLVVRRVLVATHSAATVTAGSPALQLSNCDLDPVAKRFVFSNAVADFTLRDAACTAENVVHDYRPRIYYIADCSDWSDAATCGGNGIPTLMRRELVGGVLTNTPIAEGIQEMQFEFGFDTDVAPGDGQPNEYRTGLSGAGLSNDWGNVMAVRIWLISRTTEETRGYNDKAAGKLYDLGPLYGTREFDDAYKYRVYSTLVRLNNPAGARE